MDIVLASNNKGKIEEIKEAFKEYKINILSASDINLGEVEETGETIEENALIKARAAVKKSNLISIADDTGLFVEALNGEPGVYSARYAGKNCTYSDNNKKLLKNLGDEKNRKAYFKTAIAIVFPDGNEKIVYGVCEGNITTECRGINGFGYDPIFEVEINGEKKTLAELTLAEKNRISHRGKAIEECKKYLEKFLK